MASLLNASGLSKQYGAVPLFTNVSLNISERDRLGLVGPNGSGKSTLLQILAGRLDPDSGNVAIRKNTKLAYISQVSDFEPGRSIRQVLEDAAIRARIPETERIARVGESLGRTGFLDFEAEAARQSGGWRKRLAIAEALVSGPDILLLDEPTNHLDLAGIEWLEKVLLSAPFASVVISHDRYFLENVVTDMAELNRIYPEGLFRVRATYSGFLEKKNEFLAAQAKHQESLQNRVRTEIEWLRRGPKARATKAKARIDKAHELIGELSDLKSRSQTSRTDIDFTATDRKTKRLMEVKDLSFRIGDRQLFSDLNLVLTAGTRVGLVGPNGSGKTTLLRLLRGELNPANGEVKRADALRLVYFDQNRHLDEDLTLRRALAPHSDSVVYQDQTIHVASWAARFLFTNEQLNQPVSRLSGGERARVLIARLMLEPADVLFLDEPTNDLDIPTLEILEESLLEFGGVLILVTHDRYLLDRVSNVVWGLDGNGGAQVFADYGQWEAWQSERFTKVNREAKEIRKAESAPLPKKVKLSYKDSRDFETIETRISEAEANLAIHQASLQDPSVASNPDKLQQVLAEIETAQTTVDELYERWAELEAKIS